MKIGVIGGNGVVGRAVVYGMEKLGHQVSVYDPAIPNSKWESILDTDINFICVPTPSLEDGSCDTSIVEATVKNLYDNKYKGKVAIKSTVTPGTTKALQEKYSFALTRDNMAHHLDICFVPEFLRERCAEVDFTENHDVCIIGSLDNLDGGVIDYDAHNLIEKAHGRYPRKFIKLTATEAEFCKYFNNVYNATLVTFANSMYEVCKANGVNYSEVKNAIVQRDHITDIYLDCNENFRGYSGPCLVKDTLAMADLAKQIVPNVEFFKFIDSENNKYPKTVWEGMRE